MSENVRPQWSVSRVASDTLDLLEDEEVRCLELTSLQCSILRQMAFPWAKLRTRLVNEHPDYWEIVEQPAAYVEALEELEILLSGAYDGPTGGCPVGEVFVDRGDPSAWDFQVGDLAVDGAWHSLDLGGIITDADATRLEIGAWFLSSVVNHTLQFRKTNNVNGLNVLIQRTHTAYLFEHLSGPVSLGPDRSLDYWASTGLPEIYIIVRGWWKPAV